jgi:hypothetical protein
MSLRLRDKKADFSQILGLSEKDVLEPKLSMTELNTCVVEAKNDFKNPEFKATPKTDELEGIPVEGKPGFFYSPYDNPVDKKHILDARGLSGRKVKDPWHEGKKITIPQVKKEE